jgi:hypothetical protein
MSRVTRGKRASDVFGYCFRSDLFSSESSECPLGLFFTRVVLF